MTRLGFADEIRRVHAFFEDWFADRGDRSFGDFDDAMADEFVLVATDGDLMDRDSIVGFVEHARGSGVVEIDIVDPNVTFDDGSTVIGTYEEHQVKRGVASSRQSSVVMRRDETAPGGWMWMLVHETWIEPPGQASTPSSR